MRKYQYLYNKYFYQTDLGFKLIVLINQRTPDEIQSTLNNLNSVVLSK
jgi:hypothetical protein